MKHPMSRPHNSDTTYRCEGYEGEEIHEDSSSDDIVMDEVLKKMQASMEKKKREREAKLLSTTEAAFKSVILKKLKIQKLGRSRADATLEEFITKRALLDDHIRRLWVELETCQREFMGLMEGQARDHITGSSRTEKGHNRSVKIMAEGLKVFENTIKLLQE